MRVLAVATVATAWLACISRVAGTACYDGYLSLSPADCDPSITSGAGRCNASSGTMHKQYCEGRCGMKVDKSSGTSTRYEGECSDECLPGMDKLADGTECFDSMADVPYKLKVNNPEACSGALRSCPFTSSIRPNAECVYHCPGSEPPLDNPAAEKMTCYVGKETEWADGHSDTGPGYFTSMKAANCYAPFMCSMKVSSPGVKDATATTELEATCTEECKNVGETLADGSKCFKNLENAPAHPVEWRENRFRSCYVGQQTITEDQGLTKPTGSFDIVNCAGADKVCKITTSVSTTTPVTRTTVSGCVARSQCVSNALTSCADGEAKDQAFQPDDEVPTENKATNVRYGQDGGAANNVAAGAASLLLTAAGLFLGL